VDEVTFMLRLYLWLIPIALTCEDPSTTTPLDIEQFQQFNGWSTSPNMYQNSMPTPILRPSTNINVGCIIGWTNFGVTQYIFLPPKFNYIVLYIMELWNGIHFEIIEFNIYVMKLIGMQNIENYMSYGLLKLKIKVCNASNN
jgi:hypothetical protein